MSDNLIMLWVVNAAIFCILFVMVGRIIRETLRH